MSVVPSSVYQFGTGSGVYLGHTVVAGTYLNQLVAGGSFSTSCDLMDVGTITGERSLTSNLIGRRNQLYVTIPETVPALRNMPGFLNAPRGSELMCQYHWTAFAQEATYNVGVPGFTVPIGGQVRRESGAVTFWMRVPGTADGEDDVCIP